MEALITEAASAAKDISELIEIAELSLLSRQEQSILYTPHNYGLTDVPAFNDEIHERVKRFLNARLKVDPISVLPFLEKIHDFTESHNSSYDILSEVFFREVFGQVKVSRLYTINGWEKCKGVSWLVNVVIHRQSRERRTKVVVVPLKKVLLP